MPSSRRTLVRLRTAAVAVTTSVTAVVAFVACGQGSGAGSGDGSGEAGGNSSAVRRVPGAGDAPSPASPSPRGAVWDTSPGSIAAVGDSITRGFDACSLLSDCPEASWATGTAGAVPSLARRLLADPAEQSWNLARSGALMAELPAQMQEAAEHKPELVTVLIGANDACRSSVTRMTPPADFRADFEEAVRTLRDELPKTQVYVASVPDLMRLWSQGHGHSAAPRVWRLGICQSMLSSPQAMDAASVERRRQVRDRVVAYNTALKEVCAEDPLCRYDGGAVFDYRFTENELSPWDWFHPSKQGQRKLADIAYQQVTDERKPE